MVSLFRFNRWALNKLYILVLVMRFRELTANETEEKVTMTRKTVRRRTSQRAIIDDMNVGYGDLICPTINRFDANM